MRPFSVAALVGDALASRRTERPKPEDRDGYAKAAVEPSPEDRIRYFSTRSSNPFR